MDCIDIVYKEFGGNISADTLTELMVGIKKKKQALSFQNNSNIKEDIREGMKSFLQKKVEKEYTQLTQKIHNEASYQKNIDFITSSYSDKPAEGILALLGGDYRLRDGAKNSVELEQQILSASYGNAFLSDLQHTDLLDIFKGGTLDKEISIAKFELEKGVEPQDIPSNPQAIRIAQIMKKHQDQAVVQANLAGANINQRQDFIVRQTHDRAKISKKGAEAWVNFVLDDRLDIEKTFSRGLDEQLTNDSIRGRKLRERQQVLQEIQDFKLHQKKKSSSTKERQRLKEEIKKLKKSEPATNEHAKSKEEQLQHLLEEIAGLEGETGEQGNFSKGRYQKLQNKLQAIDKDLLLLEKGSAAIPHEIKDIKEFLYTIYDSLVTGEHLHANSEGTYRPSYGRASSQFEQQRVLHFKDGRAFHEYAVEYGDGNLFSSYMRGLDSMGKNTGLMRVLGVTPEANLKRIYTDLKQHYQRGGELEKVQELRKNESKIFRLLQEVDGSINIPDSAVMATASRSIRALNNMTMLGKVLLSSISDVASFVQGFMYTGDGFISGINNFFQSVAYMRLNGKLSAEMLEDLSHMGIMVDTISGQMLSRFDPSIHGMTSRAESKFFALTLLPQYTSALQSGAAVGHSNGLALRLQRTDFNGLESQYRSLMQQVGITEEKWDLLRMGKALFAEGDSSKRLIFTAKSIDHIPTQALENYLHRQGKQSSTLAIHTLQEDLKGSVKRFLREQVNHAALIPDAKTRSTLKFGTRAGTFAGEAARHITQFKSFPIAMMNMLVKRELLGRGSDSIWQALKYSPNGERQSLARFIGLLTIMGYVSMQTKQIIAGKKPRDPKSPNTWVAAFLQGGAAGVYGDFLFGEHRKSRGGSFAATIAGPTIGKLESLTDIYGRVKEGDKFGAAMLREGKSLIPGNNLFYVEPLMNHLILYETFETLSPGYNKRQIKRAKEEYGQEFYIKPGELSLF